VVREGAWKLLSVRQGKQQVKEVTIREIERGLAEIKKVERKRWNNLMRDPPGFLTNPVSRSHSSLHHCTRLGNSL